MAATVGVGLIGLGTVGSAVAQRLLEEWALLGERAGAIPVLRRVAVRNSRRPRALDLRTARLGDDPQGLVDDPTVEIVVEVMGGVDQASALMERALRGGKHVVTANKAAMAAHGEQLTRLAAAHDLSLRYEAAAGAGLPVISLLRDSLRGDRISTIAAVINGTTNVILTRMADGSATFEAALQEAQDRGFAEADPGADVDGHDAAAKLVLLSRLAFDAQLGLEDVWFTGVRQIQPVDMCCARALHGAIKLVARAQRIDDALALSVQPTLVMNGHPLCGVDDAENALVIESDLAQLVMVRGVGAGGASTASAVVSDLVSTIHAPHAVPVAAAHRHAVADDEVVETSGYLRVLLADVLDAAPLVLQALADRGLPVLSSTVVTAADGWASQLAVITGSQPRAVLRRAVDTLDSLTAVSSVETITDCLGTP